MIWWPFPPTFQGLSGSGNCGRGQGAVHEEMESPRDHGRGSKHEALSNSRQSCLILKPARWHGHSPGQGIYTLFKRKSLFKPKYKIMTSQKCESRHLACHQEPFAPTFRNHTCSSPTVAIWWPFPPTFQGLSGSGNCGRGQGAVHERWNHPETMAEGANTKPWLTLDDPA